MIILFDENELLFQSLGLGLLRDAKSCIVKEGLNDSFELEMQYPLTGSNFSKLALNKIILAKSNPYSQPQPFRIYSISKPINGVVTIKAFHISYDMNGIIVKPISASTPQTLIDKIQNGTLLDHPFKFYTDITESKSFKTSNYYNMRALLMGSDESVLETYKGEILFDRFNVNILAKRGSNKGASVRYAKNMKDITHEVNYERLYNGVYPFYHKEEVEVTTDTSSDGFKQVYIVGNKPYQDGWFSYSAGGEPYHPVDESPVQVASDGDYKDKVFVWNTTTQRYSEKIYNEMVNLIEYVTDLISPSDKPNWIYIDVSSLPNIVVKANTDGYFKLATDQDWSKKIKGEIVFQGSIANATDGLIMYYSEVIPSSETSQETETTNVTHVELDNKIIWLTTDAAAEMKYNRILCLDLTSEFDETPDKEKLEKKAKEYIEENKIGQYKFDTKVSFIDLASTTEGTIYDKLETIELGDTVRVVYEGLGINIELRVISTTYNVLTNKYDDIELGEKSEKISSSSVQTGDNISSLTNDANYADTTTVNKLIAKTITADLIQAKNAKLSKAQIEELQTARIKVTGLIEATQFELDTLVAKMLTADNAVIKQTLEAGTVKVKGDITVTRGSINIENTESGTVFNVDRDGNVTANSVYITGGELNINDNFIVSPDGVLTAYGAQIKGRIEAEEGLIANFIIESYDTVNGESNRLYSGEPGYKNSVLVSPGYKSIINDLSEIERTWAFLAGNSFGVTTDGLLIASNAYITGNVEATSGNIGGFTIDSTKLYSDYVEISPSRIVYGQNNEFEVKSDGTLKIQNENQYIELNNNGLTANSIYVENANIHLGHIGGFTIGEEAIYKDISSFNSEGNTSGVYLGPDGLRIGKNLKIYPNGRIMSGSKDYNESLNYVIGDYCIHLGSLYKCISDTSGAWDSSKWEEVAMTYFGVDDTGKLTASSAEIIGNITAESGYIGKSGEGFTITSKAIYNGFSDPDSSATDTGVYLGTDGIRLGKKVNQERVFSFGNLTANTYIVKSIEDDIIEVNTYEDLQNYDVSTVDLGQVIKVLSDSTHSNEISYYMLQTVENQIKLEYISESYSKTNYIGSEFILSYDPKPYDRYIIIREKENASDIDDDNLDYLHIDNPNFIPVRGKTLSEETIFSISNSDYTYISVDDSSLWKYNELTQRYDFKGTNGLRLYFDQVSSITMIDVEYFDSKEEWLLGQNPHTRFSGRINITSNKSSVEFVLALTDSPWLRFKIYSGQSYLTNCKIDQDKPKIVLLPANSSSIDFTAVKYNNIKLKYDHGDQSSTPEVSNIKLILKILPGFLVTPDGMMNAYNAKIWGSFIGDVNISGGAIRIKNNAETQVFEVTDQGYLTANAGNIAGFEIDENSIHKNTPGEDNSVMISTGSQDNSYTISGKTKNNWAFTAGKYFGVDILGNLYSSSGTIGGFVITSDSIKNDNSSAYRGTVLKAFDSDQDTPDIISNWYPSLDTDSARVRKSLQVSSSIRIGQSQATSTNPDINIFFIDQQGIDTNIGSNSYLSKNGLVTTAGYYSGPGGIRYNEYYYSKIPARDIMGIPYIQNNMLMKQVRLDLESCRTNPIIGWHVFESTTAGINTLSFDTGLTGIYINIACYDSSLDSSDHYTNYAIESWSSGGTIYCRWNNHLGRLPVVKVLYIGYKN